MNAFQKKVTLRVFGIHVVVIFLVTIVPLMQSCFRTKPKELVTFIEFGAPAEPVAVETVSHMADPEPPPPDPPPVEIPEPVKKKPEPVKKKPEPVKKKPTYTRPEDIKIGKRVNETPKTPAISQNQIRQSLSGITKSAPTSGNPSEISAYDALIHRSFNNAWAKPASSATRPAQVTISLSSSGGVTSFRLSQSSGDSQFDASVMNAVRGVKRLSRKPPKGYPLSGIVVGFEIVN